MLLDAAIGTIIQLLLFTSVPFLYYWISYRGRGMNGFWRYVGLYKPLSKTMLEAVGVSFVFLLALYGSVCLLGADSLFKLPGSVAERIKINGLNNQTIAAFLIVSFFQNALSEELLFRGFLGKRLGSLLGFRIGNLVQTFLFSLVHTALFIGSSGGRLMPVLSLVLLVITAAAAYVLGLLRERGNGSIVPGIMAHGMCNFLFLLCSVYSMR